ncbi:hypothetical protein NDU88_000114 [Pleurodeles waltl]|uniref:Uncharacterized protein n=1 Tax=Pleurodeles waltl TaxID=8319 RepID=A0AAV7S6M8_PLEWA|nr:hypothetical protein NDU88_000114 [Pleurodeles waltl]
MGCRRAGRVRPEKSARRDRLYGHRLAPASGGITLRLQAFTLKPRTEGVEPASAPTDRRDTSLNRSPDD